MTDVPAPLKICPVCKAEFFVEAVSTVNGTSHSTAHSKRYTLRCASGHEKNLGPGGPRLVRSRV